MPYHTHTIPTHHTHPIHTYHTHPTHTHTDTIPLDVVAGLPVAFGTAHLALVQRARIRAGQWVLVLGAAGGVGLAATQVRAGGCVD